MNESNFPIWPGWETVRIIGRGSFGAVYEIRRDVFGDIEKAALKHISIPQSDSEVDALRYEGMDDLSITEAFKDQAREIVNEYKLMRRLNDCPTAVSCDDVKYVQHETDFGWDVLIKMELLRPLSSRMDADGTLPEAEVIRLGRDICNTLVYCSRFHILHRDIKPQNIMVSDAGLYKLGDFGIARAKAGSSTGTARIGTYDYMAPEVYFGGHYDASADLYSLGVVLYWLLNRRRTPFQPLDKARMTADEKEAARQRRFRGEPIPAPVDGSPALRRIVLKACAYDPKDRYRDASEMLRDLEALSAPAAAEAADETVLPPRPAPIPATGPAAVPEKDDTTVTDNGQNRYYPQPDPPEDGGTVSVHTPPAGASVPVKKKKKAPWVLASLLILALLIGGAIYGLNRPKPDKVYSAGGLTYVLDGETLTISGEGEIADLSTILSDQDRETIKAVVIEDGVISIGANAFWGCSSLVSVTIPDSVTHIGSSAFRACSSLASVTIPDSVTSIGWGAFTSCSSLRSVTIPDSVTAIDNIAFWGCSSLVSVTIPDSVTHIGSSAFRACSSLASVTIPDSVTSIGDEAFQYCRSLTSVTIPDSVTAISDGAFYDCSSLASVTIPAGVTAIGSSAFSGCSSLTSVTIPAGVTSIDYCTFLYCSSLSSVTIPDSVISIGSSAFYGCSSLTDVYYGGTQRQWDAITIHSDNDPLTGAKIHYNAS